MRACLNRAGKRCGPLVALVGAGLACAGTARAGDATEVWPELTAFLQLNERARLVFDAAYAFGKESDLESVDLAAFLDVSLKPIVRFRQDLLTQDWQRNKYLWARMGYDRVFEVTDSTGADVAEDRGVVALYGRIPLPAAVWLETRTRADFRWIGDEYSNRYRFRLDLSREFAVADHAVVPYGNFEWFYDTRYDDWARTLATVGAEVTLTDHFRCELYVARQADRVPHQKDLDALGVVFKWYY